MAVWVIVLICLSPLIMFLAFYLFLVVEELVVNRSLSFLVAAGQEKTVSELLFLVCVCGPIRVGKTSFCGGLIDHYVSYLIELAQKTVSDFREINPCVNFFILDWYIRRLYKVYFSLSPHPSFGLLWINDCFSSLLPSSFQSEDGEGKERQTIGLTSGRRG
jgi:hypothetical protein